MEGQSLEELSLGDRIQIKFSDSPPEIGIVLSIKLELKLITLGQYTLDNIEQFSIIFVNTSISQINKEQKTPEDIAFYDNFQHLPKIDDKDMYEQRNNRYKERKEYVDNLNVNVDRDVQILFNRLYKMYGCKWKENSIYISCLEATINPPYTTEACDCTDPIVRERLNKIINKSK